MADLERVREQAEALLRAHLGPGRWTFAFDRARTRAGLCDYAARRISVSRHLAARYDDAEVHQVLLHEVAHALAGPRAGHGPRWRAVAGELGYTGGRVHDGEVATELAPWVGTCPVGHDHYRYRRPTRPLACGRCARRYDPLNLITWMKRDV